MPSQKEKLGLIAGNGKFPFLVLDAARAQGFDVVVAAIKEETFPEIESHGNESLGAAAVHWFSLGELSKLIEMFQGAGVKRAIMAGQVRHKQIFSSIRPDWRLAKILVLAHDTQYGFAAGCGGEGSGRGRDHSRKFNFAA